VLLNLAAVLQRGRGVQVDPMKPTLKAPGYERLKLRCDDLAFKFCFRFQLPPLQRGGDHAAAQARLLKVWRCSLTLSNPR